MQHGDNQHSRNEDVQICTSQTEAADLLNVSRRTVVDAKTVHDKGSPELIEAVEQGEVSVSAAAEVAKTYADEPEKQTQIVEAGTVKEVAKEIKELKIPVAERRVNPSEAIATAIARVQSKGR